MPGTECRAAGRMPAAPSSAAAGLQAAGWGRAGYGRWGSWGLGEIGQHESYIGLQGRHGCSSWNLFAHLAPPFPSLQPPATMVPSPQPPRDPPELLCRSAGLTCATSSSCFI